MSDKDRINEILHLRAALTESLKLQSHYANLLNMYDGGKRLQFEDIDAWMARLAQTAPLHDDEKS